MKTVLKLSMLSILFLGFVPLLVGQEPEDSISFEQGMPVGMKGSYGTEQAEILTVFAAEVEGARFRAYQIKWKGQDVIVSDPLGTTDFSKGDTITFMVQKLEMPVLGRELKMIQFMIMDASAFMPKADSGEEKSEEISE